MTIRQLIKRIVVGNLIHRQRLYVFNYHIIDATPDSHCSELGTHTSVAKFRENIERLIERYRFVDLYDWHTDQAVRADNRAAVAVTFDDGHRSVVDFALPILAEYKIPCTLFVNSGYWPGDLRICWSNVEGPGQIEVGGQLAELADAIRTARTATDLKTYYDFTQAIENFAAANGIGEGYLSFEELRSASSNLVKIGMHGDFHHRHILFDRTWQAQNILRNRDVLQSLENFVPLFAFPFGTRTDLNGACIKLCQELGVIPVFHNGGYNVGREVGVRRIPADNRNALELIHGQSPVLHRYDFLH